MAKQKKKAKKPQKTVAKKQAKRPVTKAAKPVAKPVAKKTAKAIAKPTPKKPAPKKPAATPAVAAAPPPAAAPVIAPPVIAATVASPMIGVPVAVVAAAPAPAKPAAKAKAGKAPNLTTQRKAALEAKTLPELKAMLKLNDQITTGTKGKLVKRILDCVEHGALPRCPSCGLGRLKLSKYSGFRCPGGYDDDEYQFCGFTAGTDELERPAWQFETPGLV